MRIIIETDNIKKNNISVNALLIYEAMKQIKIRPYRKVFKNIFGFSERSITRYFQELKKAGLIEQKHPFNTNKLKDKENNVKEIFDVIYEKIKQGGKK